MKRIHFIISAVAVVVLLIVFFVFWLFTGRSQVKAPGNTSSAQKNSVQGMKIERRIAKCEDFDISDANIQAFPNLKKMEKGSKGSLTDDFPATPSKTELCGSMLQLDSTYYITLLSSDEVINYYKRELPLRGYQILNVSKVDTGDQIIEFQNDTGIGAVYTFYDRTAYSVSYTSNE
jgi:hypothetical protein